MLLKTERPHILESHADLAVRIDETLLAIPADQTPQTALEALCERAKTHRMRAVCVRPEHVAVVVSHLAGSGVKVASVIAFPSEKSTLQSQHEAVTFGDWPLETKLAQIEQAKADGADELDVLMNIREFLDSSAQIPQDSPIQYELTRLVEAADGTPIKLIIETDLLNDEDIAKATHAAIASGIDMIKTSTGMLENGKNATPENVRLIFDTIENAPSTRKPGIKASGGIRSLEQAVKLFQAGADIIGTSAGVKLLGELETN